MDRIPSSEWPSPEERPAIERLNAPALPPPLRARSKRIHPAVNLLFFLATVYSTLVAGTLFFASELEIDSFVELLITPSLWVHGMSYSFCVLAILGAHEMGHFVACRIYGVDATWPFFIPGPNPFGTFGAVIRIRSRIPDRRALFDIGVAGPIAGFVVAVPVLIYALSQSTIIPSPSDRSGILFPDCPLISILGRLFLDLSGDVQIQPHPTYFAAWIGLFATSLNLLPLGQLDGGHIVYALSRRAHFLVTRLGAPALILIGYLTSGHHLILFGLIFVFIGRSHPPLLEEQVGLGRGRMLVAWLALLIFILCFIPSSPSIVAGGSG